MTTTQTELKALPSLSLTFPEGLPGLAAAKRFHLEPLGEGLNVFGMLIALDPVTLHGETEARELKLVVAAPGLLWPEFSVEVPDEAAELIGLSETSDPSEAVALVIVSVGEDLSSSTANLFAPIVLNPALGLGVQVVPHGTEREVGWSVSTPMPPALFA